MSQNPQDFSVSLTSTVHDAASSVEAAREFFRINDVTPDVWGTTVTVDSGTAFVYVTVRPEDLHLAPRICDRCGHLDV